MCCHLVATVRFSLHIKGQEAALWLAGQALPCSSAIRSSSRNFPVLIIASAPARKTRPGKDCGRGNPRDVSLSSLISSSTSLYTQHPENTFGRKRQDRECEPIACDIISGLIIIGFLTRGGFSLLGNINDERFLTIIRLQTLLRICMDTYNFSYTFRRVTGLPKPTQGTKRTDIEFGLM